MGIEELKELQLKIIDKNKKCNKYTFISIIFLFIVTLVVVLLYDIEPSFIIFMYSLELIISLIVCFIVKTYINSKDIDIFNKNFKSIFVLKALNTSFDDIEYIPDKGFEEEYVSKMCLMNTSDVFNSNDYISGKYKKINFSQADVNIKDKHKYTDSDGKTKTTYVTLFEGRLMSFDFNKSFIANVQVSSKKFNAESLSFEKKYSKVKMEDVEFNKNFNVYAENEHEAFYLLTPPFIEKIKEIYKRLNCGIMFSFVNNKLHIAIDNDKDAFEYDVLKVIDEKKIEENIINDIKLITDLIDELKLDSNLFGRGA